MEASPAQQAARDRIAAVGFASLAPSPCAPTAAASRAAAVVDPQALHGPYYAEWIRKIGAKTVARRLTNAERQPLFNNAGNYGPCSGASGPHPHRGRFWPER